MEQLWYQLPKHGKRIRLHVFTSAYLQRNMCVFLSSHSILEEMSGFTAWETQASQLLMISRPLLQQPNASGTFLTSVGNHTKKEKKHQEGCNGFQDETFQQVDTNQQREKRV